MTSTRTDRLPALNNGAFDTVTDGPYQLGLRNITDGLSNTFLIGEINHAIAACFVVTTQVVCTLSCSMALCSS